MKTISLLIIFILYMVLSGYCSENENLQIDSEIDKLIRDIPDFSNCGYRGGDAPIPRIDIVETLKPSPGDQTRRIQEVIDRLSNKSLDNNGFRGAILCKAGVYNIDGTIQIRSSGIVLYGEGKGKDGTIFFATGKKKRNLIEIHGDIKQKRLHEKVFEVVDKQVSTGAKTMRINSVQGLSIGDKIIVRRIGNQDWIHEIGMDRITPRPFDNTKTEEWNKFWRTKQWEPFNLDFDREVAYIEGNVITLDAPIGCAIDVKWGGGKVYKRNYVGEISQIGIENIRGVSEYDPQVVSTFHKQNYFSDEDHAWTFIHIQDSENVWIKNVSSENFAYACVDIGRRSKWVTVQDSENLHMVSEIDGGRRYPFVITGGQLCLVQRCYSRTGRHDFSFGARICGPNVFLDCIAEESFSKSEPHHRWSVCGLYDNVRVSISIQDRQYSGTGHGWAGANFVVWNCEGDVICQKPPTADNLVVGHIGRELPGTFAKRDRGTFISLNNHVSPRSLYLFQLERRLGRRALSSHE